MLPAPAVDLIESMLFDPDSGIALLEMHLERIRASAAELGFSFDRHGARNTIQALCFDLDQRCKLRLLASRGGIIALEAQVLPAPDQHPLACIALPPPPAHGAVRPRPKTSEHGKRLGGE